jgi:hypothetical protein
VSAFGDKADIPSHDRHVRFWPKADVSGSKPLPRNLIPKPYIAGRKTLL